MSRSTFSTEWDNEANPAYDVWTSVNGSEVVPGIISPLMASVFTRYDYEGLTALMATYPAGAAVQHFRPPVANFFGVFGGRLALNNGYSVAAVSALDPAIAQAILQQFFTGAAGGDRFIVAASAADRETSYAEATRQRDAAPAKLAADHARLMDERGSDRSTQDLQLGLAEAWARFKELCRDNASDLLNTHYVVSVAAGEFQVRLGGLLVAGGADPAAVVGLCSGLGEVESSKPAVALFNLAMLAKEHPEVTTDLEAGDTAGVLATLADPPSAGWRIFAPSFAEFLGHYGYRVQGEADPTNADWAEQPTFALSQVRAMLALDADQSPARAMAQAQADRLALEALLRAQLPEEMRTPFDEARGRAQHFTRLRELSKAVWILGARRARAPYRAVCRGLAEAGAIATVDDARMLTMTELDDVVAGTPAPDLAERIARRHRQTAEAENYRLADNWVGPARPERRVPPRKVSTLGGLGVSAGAGPVTGTARIIASAEAGHGRDIDPGDVLVAPFTDAPWTPLFVTAGAVVVETGGVLSHAATVAREFGIPAVVMVRDATVLIGDGDTVTVDGAAGTVTVVERAPVPSA